jgi:hypothetical protein
MIDADLTRAFTIRVTLDSDRSREFDLVEVLKKIRDVRIYEEFTESADWLTPVVVYVLPGLAYVGDKLFDLIMESVRKWLDSRPDAVSVEIYGPDGKVQKIVKKAG